MHNLIFCLINYHQSILVHEFIFFGSSLFFLLVLWQQEVFFGLRWEEVIVVEVVVLGCRIFFIDQ